MEAAGRFEFTGRVAGRLRQQLQLLREQPIRVAQFMHDGEVVRSWDRDQYPGACAAARYACRSRLSDTSGGSSAVP